MGLLSLIFWSFLFLFFAVVVYAIHSYRKRAAFYKKHGIPYLGAGFSRAVKFFTGSSNLVQVEFEIYEQAVATKAPFVGMSDAFGGNAIEAVDLDLIKNIYVKDFDHFVNRRPVDGQVSNKYFRKMLFASESEQWKGIRTKLSPSFTTGKIRRMFQIFNTSSKRMETYMKNMIPVGAKSGDINFEQIFPKYAMDVIASCAFGIDSKSWDVAPDQRSRFEQMGKKFQFTLDVKAIAKFLMMTLAPRLMDFLGVEAMDYESMTYFSNVIRDVMKRRRETGERQEDFLQLMMDAQLGLLKADEETKEVMNGSGSNENHFNVGESKIHFDDDDIVANGMLFLLGGFDPTQSVMIFTLYCLALEPEVQKKLYEEIKLAKEKNGGELTYEALLEMSYLDLVMNESMRLYPPSAATERACTRDYPVPGSDFTMKKGTIVNIPIHPVHHDPRYFPNPKKFIPERFTSEEKAKRNPYAFMPFGHGPRNCIAMRFAIVKVKAVIAQMVGSFQFAPCARTTIPMEFGKGANIKPKYGMWINVTPRC